MTVVFYDVENIVGGMNPRRVRYFQMGELFDLIVGYPEVGGILEHRGYCPWNRPFLKPLLGQMKRLGITQVEIRKPVYDYRKRERIKNFADLYIFMDALDFAYTNPHVDCFVFVSMDSDFAVLAERLRGMGKRVLLFENGFHLPPSLFIPKIPPKNEPGQARHMGQLIKDAVKRYRSVTEFDVVLGKVLEECVEDEIFHRALCEQGINISAFYQNMKNGHGSVSYKSSGIKHMPQAFAQALCETEFCVYRQENLYFLALRDFVPEEGEIVVFEEREEEEG